MAEEDFPGEKVLRDRTVPQRYSKTKKKKTSFKRRGVIDPTLLTKMSDSDAENAVLSSVEQRFKYTQKGEDGFHPAVKGETPTLGISSLDALENSLRSSTSNSRRSSTQSFNRMMLSQRMEARAAFVNKQNSVREKTGHKGGHHRAHTLLSNMIGNEADHVRISDSFGGFRDARNIDKTFRDYDSSDEEQDDFLETEEENIDDDKNYAHEGLPLLNRYADDSFRSRVSERKLQARKLLEKNIVKRCRMLLNPYHLFQELFRWFLNSILIRTIPLFVVAIILFYMFGNPSTPDYIPGDITVSWLFDFVGRQLLMLELSMLTQTFLVDGLFVTNRAVPIILGPGITIFCLQSKGWPFITVTWGIWDLLLFQGTNKWKQHWFYFTGLKIYSEGNSGSFIINCDFYLKVLFSMILCGLVVSLKRTMIALFFSGRMVDTYKPRLEEILNDVITISEVAELSIESEDIADLIGIEQSVSDDEPPIEVTESSAAVRRRGRLSVIRWSEVKFEADDCSSSDDSVTDFLSSLPENTDEDDSSNPEDYERDSQNGKEKLYNNGSTRIALKNLLDKWDEPVMKNKSLNISIADTIIFQRAIGYIDHDYTFSESFGAASTRNEMIVSAESVYKRLMKLSDDPGILSFSVFDILLLQEDGTEDKIKKKRLMNVFHPQTDGSLPLLSFVQGCDNVYKKLRFLRASVGNSSVIDNVLELLIDPIVYFLLVVIVLSILGVNIVSLLPISTVILGGTFAFGPACGKAFEGIILIVARRPYDIGDRIVITDSAGSNVPQMNMSWIVEDISLLSTTLRFGATNEVATVSNSSLAYARITNCNRSEKATVHMLLYFHISCHVGGTRTLEMFREGIEEYIREKPNTWDSLFLFRCQDIDPNNEVATYLLAVRSSHTWQVSNRVLEHRGKLHQFAVALSFKLHINYDAPNERRILYHGGSLVNGGVEDYKSRVLKNSNINNKNDGNILTENAFQCPTTPENSSYNSRPIVDKRMNNPYALQNSQKETPKPKTSSKSGKDDDGLSPISENSFNDDDKSFLSMLQDSQY